MKKLLLSLIIIFLATTTTVMAQSRLGWGAKIGFNVSSIHGDEFHDFMAPAYKGDLTLGVFIDYRTWKWLSFGAELLYSGQGVKLQLDEVYIDMRYMLMPVLANFHITKGLALKSGIQLGLNMGMRTRSRNDAIDFDSFDDFRLLNLAVPIGISYTLRSGFIFDLRYTFDLTSINSDVDNYNSVFTLTLGLRL